VCNKHAADPQGALAATSAAVLRALAADLENCKVIVAEGGVGALMHVLRGGSSAAPMQAEYS
jgi:hypothetical protein